MRRTLWIAVLSGLVGALIAVPVAVYAAHTFNDVPSSNTFHSDIDWLAEAGITQGCNPPSNDLFCPEEEVTREQMAAFMHRFAEYLGAEDGTPARADHADTANTAGNAQQLQGNTVADLVPRAAFVSTGTPSAELPLEVEITAPAPGVILANGSVDAYAGPDEYSCHLYLDGSVVRGSGMASELDNQDNSEENCTTGGGVAVDAGTHTVTLNLLTNENVATFHQYLWALWVPFDGSGSVPSGATSLGDPAELADSLKDR